MEFENDPLKITPEIKKLYFEGSKNRALREYFYLREGLNLLNEFRYLILGIFGIAMILKITSITIIAIIFISSVPILRIMGNFWTHYAKRPLEWFGIEFTTHFSKFSIQLAEENRRLLQEILDELKKQGKS